MTTSKITRNYWIDKAKGWAEAKLSPPQADEFNSVMDELVDEDEAAQKEIERLQSELKAVTDAAKELYARLYLNFVIVDSPLETEEYIRNTIIKYKLYEEGEE